jgi:hypothetical protein
VSRATEVAEREALEAEGEPEVEPDETEAEELAEIEREQEVEPEPEPEPSSLALMEAQGKALDSEQKRHANALAKALGEHWGELAECPLCQVDGYAMPYGPGEVSPEQRMAVLTVLGEGPGQGLKPHPDLEMCAYCDGWGRLTTGSKNEGALTEICPKCSNQGYVTKNTAPEVNGSQLYTPPPPPYIPPFDPGSVNHDKWGRDPGNPRYGQDPAMNGGLW